jgi:hypothetical protein
MLGRFRDPARAVKRRELRPASGDERAMFIKQRQAVRRASDPSRPESPVSGPGVRLLDLPFHMRMWLSW